MGAQSITVSGVRGGRSRDQEEWVVGPRVKCQSEPGMWDQGCCVYKFGLCLGSRSGSCFVELVLTVEEEVTGILGEMGLPGARGSRVGEVHSIAI